MASLRSKAIRLAHAKPELRPHLLPLLAKSAKMPWGGAEDLPWAEMALADRRALSRKFIKLKTSVASLQEATEILRYAPEASGEDLLFVLKLLKSVNDTIREIHRDIKDVLAIP